MIEVNGFFISPKVSNRFAREIKEAWLGIPEEVREYFAANNLHGYAGQTVSDVFPAGRDEERWQEAEKEYGDHCGAFYFPFRPEVIIPEYTHLDPTCTYPPDRKNVIANKWKSNLRDRVGFVKATVWHEGGHAIDFLQAALPDLPGTPIRGVFSQDRAFVEAREKDIQAMGGIEKAKEKGYRYLLPPKHEDAARGETFAELWAESQGVSILSFINKSPIARDWPNAYKWMQEFNAQYREALRTGHADEFHAYTVEDARVAGQSCVGLLATMNPGNTIPGDTKSLRRKLGLWCYQSPTAG